VLEALGSSGQGVAMRNDPREKEVNFSQYNFEQATPNSNVNNTMGFFRLTSAHLKNCQFKCIVNLYCQFILTIYIDNLYCQFKIKLKALSYR